jgi:hypothetical protein
MRQVAALLLLLAVGAVVAHAGSYDDEYGYGGGPYHTRKHKGYQ